MAETYSINWGAVNEVLDRLKVVQSHIDALTSDFDSGNTKALAEWASDVRDAFNAHKVEWVKRSHQMQAQAAQAQAVADSCKQEYQGAYNFGMQLFAGGR
ncbi:hypothetical protein ACE1SV_68890 [Streptomyces sp. E-15]|uniref:hypothetical protein n=1 Tax=Streptomyces sp. NPDC012751 TaxID=3364846 RepID=UPI0035D15AA3